MYIYVEYTYFQSFVKLHCLSVRYNIKKFKDLLELPSYSISFVTKCNNRDATTSVPPAKDIFPVVFPGRPVRRADRMARRARCPIVATLISNAMYTREIERGERERERYMYIFMYTCLLDITAAPKRKKDREENKVCRSLLAIV